jgi:hypothetical protein
MAGFVGHGPSLLMFQRLEASMDADDSREIANRLKLRD